MIGVDLGRPGSERTVIAIWERQKESDRLIEHIRTYVEFKTSSLLDRLFRRSFNRRRVVHWRGKKFCINPTLPKIVPF